MRRVPLCDHGRDVSWRGRKLDSNDGSCGCSLLFARYDVPDALRCACTYISRGCLSLMPLTLDSEPPEGP